jgi:hypothetical protein
MITQCFHASQANEGAMSPLSTFAMPEVDSGDMAPFAISVLNQYGWEVRGSVRRASGFVQDEVIRNCGKPFLKRQPILPISTD